MTFLSSAGHPAHILLAVLKWCEEVRCTPTPPSSRLGAPLSSPSLSLIRVCFASMRSIGVTCPQQSGPEEMLESP
jgi:hypothetical protein